MTSLGQRGEAVEEGEGVADLREHATPSNRAPAFIGSRISQFSVDVFII